MKVKKMSDTVVLSRDEYDILRSKAELFEHFVATEELSASELKKIDMALKGSFISKEEFLK